MNETDDAHASEAVRQAESSRGRRGTLHGEATDRLRTMVITGELPPGMRLKEVALCDQLGVSRTPIREAFRTLAAEGLVTLLPNRSVVVAPLDERNIGYLYSVFGTLEGLAGEQACANITGGEISEIGGLLNEMVALHARSERAAYMDINHQIHARVVEISANPVLQSIWRSLLPRVERARALANLDRDRWTEALFEHSKMFAALAARDGSLLARLTREHFINGLPASERVRRPDAP
ncbi:GntR family transcriptional regulator [Pelagibacterium montanilacus]|uniref:GntR family transcriptional regulator n=1 Tax=Pelagibacterium montanilacus TaxID=2185280 RepID=UPI000F8F2FEC|nr:GntR family transcriptional regulator [Pelagibacterium montanilacus]